MTDRRILEHPMGSEQAVAHVESWLALPSVAPLCPGPSHTRHLTALFNEAGTAGRLTTDIHLAALAIDNNAQLCSNDSDFARFKSLRWFNPLS